MKIAVVGVGPGLQASIKTLEEIALRDNREIEIFSCGSIEEAKDLGITIVVSNNDDLSKPRLLDMKLTNTISSFEEDKIQLSINDADDWNHKEGTKQKKVRKGNNRKKKKRRK